MLLAANLSLITHCSSFQCLLDQTTRNVASAAKYFVNAVAAVLKFENALYVKMFIVVIVLLRFNAATADSSFVPSVWMLRYLAPSATESLAVSVSTMNILAIGAMLPSAKNARTVPTLMVATNSAYLATHVVTTKVAALVEIDCAAPVLCIANANNAVNYTAEMRHAKNER